MDKGKIHFKTTQLEIKDAIDRLFELGLLCEIEGKLVKKNRNLSNNVDVFSKGTQKYHQNVSALAAEAVVTQGLDQREFNGFAFNIDPKDLPDAKREMRDFVKKFISKYENEAQSGINTYQFNMQLFELTKKENQ